MSMEYRDEEAGLGIELGPSTFTLVLPARAVRSDKGSDLESFLSSRGGFSRAISRNISTSAGAAPRPSTTTSYPEAG